MRGNDLKTEFSKFGEVVSARVNLDQTTKPPRSRGFGFVEFSNAADAAKAQATEAPAESSSEETANETEA